MALLLLKAALPGVLVAAAQVNGVRLVELCTVYGVQTIAVDHRGAPLDGAPAGSGDVPAATGCALASLPAFDLPVGEGTPPAAPAALAGPRVAAALDAPPADDPSRTWWSRLKQAPPQA